MRCRLRLSALLLLIPPAMAAAQPTLTPVETFTPFRTFTPVQTFTPFRTFTPVLTFTPFPSPTVPGPSRIPTRTRTPTRTATATPSRTPTGGTPTASATRSPSRTPSRTPPLSPTAFEFCVGDCSGDGVIVVNEIITGVLIAQSPDVLASCGAFDRNGDQLVSIDELVAAVGYALGGCP